MRDAVKSILLFTLLLLCAFQARAQNPKVINELLEKLNFAESDEVIQELTLQIGEYYLDKRAYQSAVTYFQRGIEISKKMELEEKEAIFSERLGDAYLLFGVTAEAENAYKHALSLYEKTSIPLIEKLLEVNYDLEDWKEAIICNKMIVDHFNKEGNEIKYVQSLNNQGFLERKSKNLEKSNEIFTKAIGLYNVLIKKKVPLESIVYINAGATANQLSDYKQAIEYFNLALEKAERQKDEASKAAALNFLGVTYYMQRDIDKAIKRIESSIEVSENYGIDQELIVSYRLLEEIYQSLGIPSKVNEVQIKLRALEKAERDRIAEKKQDITRSDLDASTFESELQKLSADKQRDQAAA